MPDKKKIAVKLKVNRGENPIPVIDSLFSNTVNPDILFLDMPANEFPNRVFDIPQELLEYVNRHSMVKFLWNSDVPFAEDECEMLDVEDWKLVTDAYPQNLKVSEKRDCVDMTMVSVFYDAGINPLRKVATKKAFACWMKQSHLPDEILFIELGFNGEFTFSERDFPDQVQYIRIYGNDSNKYLFQKEYLWNIGAKMAKHEKLFFVDSDFAPIKDDDWFKKAHDVLDNCLFTQGFRRGTYLDGNGNPTKLSKFSCGHNLFLSHLKNHRFGFPGGCFCIEKKTLEQMNWFNNIPFGGGDTLLWNELLGIRRPRQWIVELIRRDGIRESIKQMAKKRHVDIIGDVDVDVCHFYHGVMKNRSYVQRDYMWTSQYPWFGRIIQLDSNGILQWIDTEHYFYKALANFHTINDDIKKAAQLLSPYIDFQNFVADFDRFGFADNLKKEDIQRLVHRLRQKYEDCEKAHGFGRTIVTFTSYPKRIGNCERVIETALKQTWKPDIVYLNLSIREFPRRMFDLPSNLVDLICKNPAVKVNWVPGPNTKSMKKALPILDLVNDEDIIIVTDDDVLLNNENIIKTWRDDFMKNQGKCAIVGNSWKAGGFPDMFMTCGDLICSRKMLANREPFMIPEILNTYHDDRLYISLFWLNGFKTVPASKFLMGKTRKSDIDYGFNDGLGMSKTNQYVKSADFDKIFRPIAEKIYGRKFEFLFDAANNSR